MDIAKEILLPMLTAAILSLVLGKFIIKILKKKHIGQEIRDDGPKSHYGKAGTPTMGGIIFILSTILTLLFTGSFNKGILVVTVGMLAFGGIGFIDDFMKLVMKRSLGLDEKEKLILQFIVSIVMIFLCKSVMRNSISLQMIPFMNTVWDMKFFAYPFLIFVMIGTVNATNLTDGLDGLCTSVSLPVFITMTIIAIMSRSGIRTFPAVFTGALLGFLVYNSHKASVFMGDTGSMAIGGALVTMATIYNMSIYLIILGGIYVIEVLSVIIQTTSYKLRNKKRVFLMSPIHHHFELKGYSEPKIVAAFMTVSTILSLITLYDMLNI